MSELLAQITTAIERGKVNAASPYPPDMKGQPGADELTKSALDAGIKADAILAEALIPAMSHVGKKYSDGQAFVPDLLMAAKAMKAAMVHLKPFFDSGETLHRGTFIIGTVQGDLHDIGKNLVAMMLEGGGYKVIDLGVDVSAEKFVEAVRANPGSIVGLSALLTTTMINMEKIIAAIREASPETKVIIGGAPVNEEFARKITADAYAPDPQRALDYLDKSVPAAG